MMDDIHNQDGCEEAIPGFATDSWGPYYWHYSEIGQNGNLYFSTNGSGSSVWTVDFYYIYWSGDNPQATPTPQITETPTVAPGMCTNPAGYYEPADDSGVSIYSRDGSCMKVLPELAILQQLGEMGLITSSWEGLEVCVRYWGFEEFKVLGIELEMMDFFYAMAGIGVFRFIRKRST